MKCISNLIRNSFGPPLVSPVGDVNRPDAILFADGQAYDSLFSGFLLKRSPGRVRREGSLDRLLQRSALRKIESDTARDFDISCVLYPMGMDLAAWGTVVDRVGRVFHASSQPDGSLQITYEGGCCRSGRDWRVLVGTRSPDEESTIRMFYNKARLVAADRVVVAGTVGFGLWDALWMSFNLEQALELLEYESDFIKIVFTYWKEFHLAAVRAMLDAGTRLIFLREHPAGFPPGYDVASKLDPFLGDFWRDISRAVRSRGGSLFLDCNADEMLETDYPLQWGFDGIGPMLFRDGIELRDAAAGLSDDLTLVGTLSNAVVSTELSQRIKRAGRVVLTEKPEVRADRSCDGNQVVDEAGLSYAPEGAFASVHP